MSKLQAALSTEAGRAVIGQVIGSVSGLLATLPRDVTQSGAVLELCLLEQGRQPVTYQTLTVWAGDGALETVHRAATAYGEQLAKQNIGNRTRLEGHPNASHYVSGTNDDDPVCILVIVAGPSAAHCRRLAQYAATGIMAGLSFL